MSSITPDSAVDAVVRMAYAFRRRLEAVSAKDFCAAYREEGVSRFLAVFYSVGQGSQANFLSQIKLSAHRDRGGLEA